jgi:hypothetical protein
MPNFAAMKKGLINGLFQRRVLMTIACLLAVMVAFGQTMNEILLDTYDSPYIFPNDSMIIKNKIKTFTHVEFIDGMPHFKMVYRYDSLGNKISYTGSKDNDTNRFSTIESYIYRNSTILKECSQEPEHLTLGHKYKGIIYRNINKKDSLETGLDSLYSQVIDGTKILCEYDKRYNLKKRVFIIQEPKYSKEREKEIKDMIEHCRKSKSMDPLLIQPLRDETEYFYDSKNRIVKKQITHVMVGFTDISTNTYKYKKPHTVIETYDNNNSKAIKKYYFDDKKRLIKKELVPSDNARSFSVFYNTDNSTMIKFDDGKVYKYIFQNGLPIKLFIKGADRRFIYEDYRYEFY